MQIGRHIGREGGQWDGQSPNTSTQLLPTRRALRLLFKIISQTTTTTAVTTTARTAHGFTACMETDNDALTLLATGMHVLHEYTGRG